MFLPDRHIAPEINTIENFKVILPEISELPNGCKILTVQPDYGELVRIDVGFDAGSYYAEKPLLASYTVKMLSEGSKNYKASEIAFALDYYGCYIEQTALEDMSFVTLYVLKNKLEKVIPVIHDIIFSPVFPEKELKIMAAKGKQDFQIACEKVSFLASRQLAASLYGDNHPYGRKVSNSDYDTLQPEQLKTFHDNNFLQKPCTLVLSGGWDDGVKDIVTDWFESSPIKKDFAYTDVKHEISTVKPNVHYIEKNDAVQSSLRMGMLLNYMNEPEYFALRILNTVFGGYFGSRLMKNIREDKGYTYSIGSYLSYNRNSLALIIYSEVGANVTQKAIDEIGVEMQKLRDNVISDGELQLVRNYLIGDLLRRFDGSFALADRVKFTLQVNLSLSFFERFFQTIQTITPEQLQLMSQKYLNPVNFHVVVAGPKNVKVSN